MALDRHFHDFTRPLHCMGWALLSDKGASYIEQEVQLQDQHKLQTARPIREAQLEN